MAYRRKDGYWRMAKRAGYRSRAAYKLTQLNEKFGLMKKGDRVLDIGCAPGGWMQVASETVGERGYVLGVDIQHIRPFEEENVEFLPGDIGDAALMEEISRRGKFDVVISDISPRTTGVRDVDHFASVELSKKALRAAVSVLNVHGNFLVKVFQGESINAFYQKMKLHFNYVKISSPKATRKSSAEVYLIGKNFKGHSLDGEKSEREEN